MRKIVVNGSAGICGTDFWEFYEVPESLSEDELGDFAWRCALDNAEMYGIYPRCEDSDEDQDDDSYSDEIDGSWEKYNPEKHDGHTMTGTPKWEQY